MDKIKDWYKWITVHQYPGEELWYGTIHPTRQDARDYKKLLYTRHPFITVKISKFSDVRF